MDVSFSFSLHVVDTVHAHLSARYCSLEVFKSNARATTHTYFLTYKKCQLKISLFSINLSHLLSDLLTFSFFFHLHQFHSSLITFSLFIFHFLFSFNHPLPYSLPHSLSISFPHLSKSLFLSLNHVLFQCILFPLLSCCKNKLGLFVILNVTLQQRQLFHCHKLIRKKVKRDFMKQK